MHPWATGSLRLAGALALIAAALFAGWPELDAYWIQGDEHRFIANNPDVTGLGRPEPFWDRLIGIFFHVHEDLYQPIPIFTYAFEWQLWGEQRISMIRLTDLVLHGINAVFAWRLLAALLAWFSSLTTRARETLTWGLALLWTLHPMLVPAYAADMGRTHLLATAFALPAITLYLRSCKPGQAAWFVPSFILLMASMLCKPMVGLVVVTLTLDFALGGPRRMLTSWRSLLVAAVCVGFAALTLATSRASGIMEDIGNALFGDPITRSLLAAWLNLQHTFWPVNLAYRYLPDIRTGWTHPGVWLGLLAVAGSALAFFAALHRRRAPLVGIGLAWYWALVFPTLGLVGARLSAAQDRYLYLPLIGLLLVAGAALARWTARDRTLGIVTAVLALLTLAGLPGVRDYVRTTRQTLARAEQILQIDAQDPRAREIVANAAEFTTYHPLPGMDASAIDGLRARAADELRQAATLAASHPQYFASDSARAAFFRRLSFTAFRLEDGPLATDMALRSAALEPDSHATLTRLAHGYRLAGQFDKAAETYIRIEQIPGDDPATAALRATEFADLLLYVFNEPAAALERYKRAYDTGVGPDRAVLGLARCEVLAGQGARGFEFAQSYLRHYPNDVGALLVVALYHLRSHHFPEAVETYRVILRLDPVNYEALRGYHELCAQFDAWPDATLSWQAARERQPENPVFRSWFVWAAACSGESQAGEWADRLLSDRPGDRFGHYARMLLATRAGDYAAALDAADRAIAGSPLPEAQETARAEKTLALLLSRGQLPPAAGVVRAALAADLGLADSVAEIWSAWEAALTEAERAQLESIAARVRSRATSQGAPSGGEKSD